MLARINWRPALSETRYFAATLAVAACIVSAILYFMGAEKSALYLLCVGLAVAMLCRFVPIIGRAVYLLWMAVTFVMSLLISPIVIGAIYYLVLTPIALAARISGKDELRRQKPAKASSYFDEAKVDSSPESFKRQF